MAGFLNNIDQVRAIDWGSKHLWDVRFPDAPSPFNSFFPATEFNDDGTTGISRDQPFFISNYKTPMGQASANITFQVLDDVNNTIFNWIRDWHRKIYDDTKGLLTLSEAVRPLILVTLDRQRNTLETQTLYVFPDGGLPKSGTSTADSVSLNLTFVVAGRQYGNNSV